MNRYVLDAFEEVRHGFSVDRVIADPHLNSDFLDSCHRLGLTGTPVDLNLKLFNARKRGGLLRSSRRTVLQNQDGYAFAAEMAIRSLERKHQTTLDRVLCNPELAAEFDSVAMEIAPGHSPLEYRWAALCLRKKNRLKPEIVGRAVPTTTLGPTAVATIDISQVPAQQGVYILTTHEQVLYIGEAQSLRARLKKHLEHSDNKLLARHIWEFGKDDLLIEYYVLPPATRTDVRRAMELELIRSRRPMFNIRR
ncbi:MAG: GIY-YIG nuclease family protein [Planctomycetes bacterium]|nr:GIY-YIG nuclease family protein [Planctomycetota bacterium]